MAADTKIEWAGNTWSPWEGCQNAGPGCDHCYAEAMNKWLRKGENWGPGAPRRVYSDDHWEKPLRWNAGAAAKGVRVSVFPSVCDPFDNAAPAGQRERFWALIEATPWIDWLLLTKRIGNVRGMVPPSWLQFGKWPKHVRIGATIVNQPEADRDIAKLLALPCPNFLSMEPLLGPVDLSLPTRLFMTGRGPYGKDEPIAMCNHCCNGDRCDDPTHCDRGRPDWTVKCHHCRGTGRGKPIDWVIVGGESGRGARSMVLGWAKDIVRQCQAAGVPVMVKQLGAKPTNREGVIHVIHDKKGADMADWPEVLRVREFPK